jgi:hypothetical protein
MTRHSRKSKKKINKRPKSIFVVSPSNKGVARTPLPLGVAKITRQKKIEQDLDKMLAQLKAFVEGVDQNQMVGG